MKKSVSITIIIFLLFLTPIISATAYECSDNSTIGADSKEINENEVKSVGGLKIGVCDSSESSIQKWIESTLFIDSNIVILENSSATAGIELKSSNETIKYTSVSTDSVNLTIASTTGEIELGDCSLLGSFTVKIKEIGGSSVTVLVGNNKKILNTKQNNSDIFKIKDKNYAVTLLGGSSTNSIVKVNWCKTGEIIKKLEISQITSENNSSNQTNNETLNETTPQKIISCYEIGSINDTKYCNSDREYINQSFQGQSCTNDYECLSNLCKESLCSKQQFFTRLINWIKNLF